MRKLICILLTIIILVSATPYSTASNTVIHKRGNVSVIFESDTSFTATEQLYIADMLVYGESDITIVQPRAWCWLTGHDKKTEYVTIITHKKYSTAPRCLEEIYEVTTCSKCDLYDMVLIGSTIIACCPVD